MSHPFAVRIIQTFAVGCVGAALGLVVLAAAALSANASHGAIRSLEPHIGERPRGTGPAVTPPPITPSVSAPAQTVTVLIVASALQAAAVQDALDQAAPLLVTSGAISPPTIYVVLSADVMAPAVTANGNLVAQLVDLRDGVR